MFRDRSQGRTRLRPLLHILVSVICTPTTTYSFVISKRTGTTVNQVTDEVFYKGLIEMQEMDTLGGYHTNKVWGDKGTKLIT